MSLESKTRTGKRVALVSVAVSASLAALKIVIGLIGHSTAVVADGLESAGDVVASGLSFSDLQLLPGPPMKIIPTGTEGTKL